MTQAIAVSTARPPIGRAFRGPASWFAAMRFLIGIAALTVLMTSATYAQSGFPTRPVTSVVPFAPGGVTDIMTRSLSQELQDITGQPFVVMNKPGGTGILAARIINL